MYVSPKAQQHADGREERDRQVQDILRAMRGQRPMRRVTYRVNPVTGQRVEVR